MDKLDQWFNWMTNCPEPPFKPYDKVVIKWECRDLHGPKTKRPSVYTVIVITWDRHVILDGPEGKMDLPWHYVRRAGPNLVRYLTPSRRQKRRQAEQQWNDLIARKRPPMMAIPPAAG